MKLQEITDVSAACKLLASADEVHIEAEKNGNILRITFGPLAAPVAIVERAGTYSDNLSIRSIATKTIYRSSAVLFGSPVTKSADTETELLQWEDEVRRGVSGEQVEFTHTEEVVPA